MPQRLVAPLVVLVSVAAVATVLATAPLQQLSFRSTADLIAVDVQVVTSDGTPVPTLTKDDFKVSIGRRPRAVANATFLEYDTKAVVGRLGSRPLNQSRPTGAAALAAEQEGRTFIIAVDLLTFEVGASRAVIASARQFVQGLARNNRVGLFPYPLGQRVEATTNHFQVLRALDNLIGQRPGTSSRRFYLSNADIVDWWAGEEGRIVARECGGALPIGGVVPGGGRGNANCVSELTTEVSARTQEHEAAGMLSIGMLRDLFEGLAFIPGRKFVVLVSGGLPLSDRPGGRPNGGTSGQDLGVLAARANIGLYSLYIDHGFLERTRASNRTPNHQPVNQERESIVSGQWLGMVSAGAGGALMRVLVGDGESSFERVLRETSAYYLLGVEPSSADRGLAPQAIDVSVNQRGVTVRSRRWVVLPPAAGAR